MGELAMFRWWAFIWLFGAMLVATQRWRSSGFPRSHPIDTPPIRRKQPSPEVMNLARSMGDYLRYHSSVGNTLSELIILITEWSQDYEWYVHYAIALKAGISKSIADAIADGRRPTGMSADEEIVYDLTTEILKNKRISDATFQRAERRFGNKGVVDMVGIAGYYTFLAMQLNMARYQFSREGARLSRFPD